MNGYTPNKSLESLNKDEVYTSVAFERMGLWGVGGACPWEAGGACFAPTWLNLPCRGDACVARSQGVRHASLV